MKLQEIKDKLNTKFEKVGEPVKVGSFLGLEKLSINVMDKKDDAMWEANVYVWKDGNDYYWRNGEPKARFDFVSKLRVYIDDQIANNTIEGAFIESLNNDKEFAIVKVVIDSAGLKDRRFFVDKDASGNLQHRAIE